MRYLIISDIHANLTAFQAVLEDSGTLGEDYDFVWCLGDVVGYGPDPNECVDMLRKMPHLCLAGNHDWAALGRLDVRTFNADARKAVTWTRQTLTPDNLAFLEALPTTFVLGDFTLAHGSPREPVWEYILDPLIAALNFSYYQTPYCLVGHTHVPIKFILEDNDQQLCVMERLPEEGKRPLGQGRLIINPGSVGQPRDGDARASYAILDTDALTLEHRRVRYDIKKTQHLMQKARLSSRNITRRSYGW